MAGVLNDGRSGGSRDPSGLPALLPVITGMAMGC